MANSRGKKPLKTGVFFLMLICFVAPAQSSQQPNKKGRFTAVFEQYSPQSDAESLWHRTRARLKDGHEKKHHYDIAQETFEVYVPDNYDSNEPFGLLVWISASPDGGIERFTTKPLMDRRKLIWVGANNSGNDTGTYQRRIPLALDAAYNMQELYNIDPNRVYVGGISGGGRVASITAFHHSDVYSGGVFVIGANYWENMPVPGQKRRFPAGTTKPRPGMLLRARLHGRYVLLTGDNDGNRLQMHTYYQNGFRKCLKNVLYIQAPAMGHEIPPEGEFEKALKYLDNPVSQQPDSKTTAEKKLLYENR